MIKVVLFDMSKTLVQRMTPHTGTDLIIQGFGLTAERKIVSKTYERIVQTRKWTNAEEAFGELCKALGIEPTVENVRKMIEWRHEPDKTFEIMPQTEAILTELRKRGLVIAVLPNASQFQYEWFNQKHPEFFKQFDYVFWSYEIGLVKPDVKAYELVIEKLDVLPEEILMVGDNQENDVDVPKSLGMKAVLFEEGKDMVKEIVGNL